MGAIGNMQQYQQYQLGNAMPEIASNPGGGTAADGMGLGMGLAMAGQMAGAVGTGQAGAAPPPVPASLGFHVATDGSTQGPFPASELGGKITPETLVWSQGMVAWTPAVQVPQLAGLFATPPPPPPPPPPA